MFLDWLYGEYLHSDADKAERIQKHNEYERVYEWQFHWIAERLCTFFVRFSHVVAAILDLQRRAASLEPAE